MSNLSVTGNPNQLASAVDITSYGDGAMNSPKGDMRAAGPFASLLAERLDKTGSAKPGAAEAAAGVETTDKITSKDLQDQTAATTAGIADPANVLAAMLMQIPQEVRTSTSDAAAGTQDSMNVNSAARTPLAFSNLKATTAGTEKADATAFAPGQLKATTAGTEKADATAFAPGHLKATTAGTEKADATAFAPGQLKATTADTEKAGATASAPGQMKATTAGTEKADATAFAPGQLKATTAGTEKADATAFAPGQLKATTADAEKADATASAPGQLKATTADAEKADATAFAPGQMKATTAGTEKADATAFAPGQMKTSAATDAGSRIASKEAEHMTSASPPPAQNTFAAHNASATAHMMPNMSTINRNAEISQSIDTPFGSHAWADDFSQKISWISTQKNQIAELHLNPPDLGPLNVVLKVSDNQATALFTSPHAPVRDAVENAIPKLREMLADNGIMLGNTTVSDQPPRDRDAQSFTNQMPDMGGRHNNASIDTPKPAATAAQAAPARRHNGIVDTFA